MGLFDLKLPLIFRKGGPRMDTASTFAKASWRIALTQNKPKQKTLDDYQREYQQYQFPELRQICRDTSSILNARITLRECVFKNGFEWLPRFGSKCTKCGAEFEQKIPTCERCGATTREPDQKQQENAEDFFHDVNEYDQSLQEVLEEAEDQINQVDTAVLWLETEYELNSLTDDGKPSFAGKRVTAIESIPPELVTHNLDKEGRHVREYFCIQHRDRIYSEPGYCIKCSTPLLQAWYVYDDKKGTKRYYAQKEFIDWHFYDPKGYSPIYAILKSVLVEWGMDDELYERFWNKVLPKDIIAVTTSNPAALNKVKAEIIEQSKAGEVPFVGIESQTGHGTVQKISLTDDSVADLTNIDTRDQIKKTINTVYGVVPLYAADVERSSALSGEGQQLLVQEDRAKAKQMTYNEKVLPQLLTTMGVTDWKLTLKPPTAESEQKKLTIESMKIQNARAMLDMGFAVELDENGEFVFSGSASRPDVTMPSPFAAGEIARKAQAYDDLQMRQDEITLFRPNDTTQLEPGGRAHTAPGLGQFGEDWLYLPEEELLVKARWEQVYEAIYAGTLWQEYYGLTGQESDLVNQILTRHFTQPNISLRKIREDLIKELGLTEARADIIGRTEMSAVLNKARELDYVERDPAGEWRYKWLNPKDARTTECCRRIVDRTVKGVPLAKLKEIVKAESERFAEETGSRFRYVREFVAHYGCRSSFVRVV